MVLAKILAQMKDKSGRVRIPGFYDDVRALTRRGARAVEAAAVQREALRKELGAPKLFGETGYSTLERDVGAADVRGQRACSAASPATARRP